MANCLVCQAEFPSEANLHKHIKVHKLLLAEYYQKYFPRYDKFDGKIIKFRNKEQYLTTDFNDRENLRLWMLKTDLSTVRAYARSLLEFRRDKKGLIWTPTQIELRTTLLPPIQSYNSLFGDYYALCAELGLKNRFPKQTGFLKLSHPPPYFIQVDTREQKPFSFPNHESVTQTLKFGDYACSDSNLSCNAVIERKSPQDFVGTFSGGMERFRRELDRAVEAGAYVIVLVEDTLVNLLHFNTRPYVYHRNTRVNPEFIFHNVRELLQSYSNLQFLFVHGRERAARTVELIFDSQCTYKNTDLQFQYDLGLI